MIAALVTALQSQIIAVSGMVEGSDGVNPKSMGKSHSARWPPRRVASAKACMIGGTTTLSPIRMPPAIRSPRMISFL